jgi:hypothetical protein
MLLVAEPILGEDEKAALSDVVESGWITMADRVRDFERAFAEKHGAEGGARPARRRQASDGGYGLAPLGRIERGLERTISWWRGRLARGLVRRQMEFST